MYWERFFVYQDISPDHLAQEELTGGLSLFAGSFKEGGKT